MKKRKTAKLDQGRLAAARIRLVYQREASDGAIRANDAPSPASGHDKRGHRVGLTPIGQIAWRVINGLRKH